MEKGKLFCDFSQVQKMYSVIKGNNRENLPIFENQFLLCYNSDKFTLFKKEVYK